MSQIRNELRKLCELQQVDDDIVSVESSLKKIEIALGQEEELQRSRVLISEDRQKLEKRRDEQKPLEAEIQDLGEKIKKLETRLFEGGKGSKELTAMQQEIETEKARSKTLEDQSLEALSEIEAVQAEIDERNKQQDAREKDWLARKAELEDQNAALQKKLDDLQGKRSLVASPVSTDLINLYESVRVARGGQAVSRVERGMCKGCRLILPVSEWHRVRTGSLVRCSSCGRILCLD
ncbi:MAG: hypothetical protein HYX90_06615 [Chloroflexi bacterium]|nr:hypothetical protein [Chloroflexota bacterium]